MAVARSVWESVKRVIPRSLLGFGLTWIVEGPLARDGSDPDPLDRVRMASPEDEEVLVALGVSSELARSRLESDARVWIGELSGQPVGCVVHDIRRCTVEPWLNIETRPGSVFGFGTMVASEYRGKGIAAGIARVAEGAFADEGFQRTVGAIDFANRNSLRLTEKLGCRRTGRYAYLRILGLTFFTSPRAVRVGRFDAEHPLTLPMALFETR